jgi:hypothetical protein
MQEPHRLECREGERIKERAEMGKRERNSYHNVNKVYRPKPKYRVSQYQTADSRKQQAVPGDGRHNHRVHACSK